MLSRVSPSSLFLACIVLWTTGRRRCVGWKKKKKRKEKKKRSGERREREKERERSGDGRRCCWWWWRCAVDGERNELQDGIAVGLSDEKPWKEKGRKREGELQGNREKRAVWRRIRAKESNLCEIIRCRSACWNCFVKIYVTIAKSEKSERYDGFWCNSFLQFKFVGIENLQRITNEKNTYIIPFPNSFPFKNPSRKIPIQPRPAQSSQPNRNFTNKTKPTKPPLRQRHLR